MKKLPEVILERSNALPEGGVLAPKEFLGIGSRAAVDQAFSRLTRSGKLMRVSRGMYVVPVSSRFGQRAPATEKVVHALASKTHETIAKSGAKAANELGLTLQVPVTEVFLTSGRARTLHLGKAKVRLNHAPRWLIALGSGVAGEAVRALEWIGPKHAGEATAKLHKRLSYSEWKSLEAIRSQLPAWMAQAIGQESACA